MEPSRGVLLSKPTINAQFSKSYPIPYNVSYHPLSYPALA